MLSVCHAIQVAAEWANTVRVVKHEIEDRASEAQVQESILTILQSAM
jgi:hypothetical protein